jgi:LmbE family N-acetylglucosaminyl deacetylase
MHVDFATFAERTDAERGVFVVAPHPDDEAAGTGGLIAACVAAGVRVKVCIVTDGGASHPNSQEWPRLKMARLREHETTSALEVLGVREPPLRLGLPDASTETVSSDVHRRACRRLGIAIDRFRPGLIVTTWRREPHCDHRYAYRLARCATERSDTRIAEYLVWTHLIGASTDRPRPDEVERLELDVSSHRDTKKAALRCYRSQFGLVVQDDPDGFAFKDDDFDAMTGPTETYLL